MSFLFDKKTEHENLCEVAIRNGRTAEAVFHAAKAADFSYALAQQTGGQVGAGYLKVAESWLEIAERLQKQPLPATSAVSASSAGTSKSRQPIPSAEDQSEAGDNQFLVSELPEVTFDDIAGMEIAKTAIMEMVVYPMREPDKARALKLKPGGGVLLYGPPGNGKTMLGKAIAREIEAPFFYASGAQIRSKWHGESEQRLSRLIQSARERSVAVLFLDEVDGLLPRRASGSSVVDNRIVTQFLADIGGFKDDDNTLLLLGATNKPWEIDEAVFRTGRFDEKIYIGLPDLPARRGLLQRQLTELPLQDDLNIEALAVRLDGYTGSDIVGIIHDAKRAALRRSIVEDTAPLITNADIQQAMTTIPSSVTDKMLRQYEEFIARRFS